MNKEDIILRFIANSALGSRQNVFPLSREKTPEAVYAASPKTWFAARHLFSIRDGRNHAWSVHFNERIDSQYGSWEGYAFVDSCGRSLDFYSMPNYDEGTDKGYRKVGGAPCTQAH
ncbi:MAG: hypothetical protein SGJ17_13630 [Hyphomicrobiales bacterium]|nr:hypothetical protein [Hyphomicrobiales bacterium]